MGMPMPLCALMERIWASHNCDMSGKQRTWASEMSSEGSWMASSPSLARLPLVMDGVWTSEAAPLLPVLLLPSARKEDPTILQMRFTLRTESRTPCNAQVEQKEVGNARARTKGAE